MNRDTGKFFERELSEGYDALALLASQAKDVDREGLALAVKIKRARQAVWNARKLAQAIGRGEYSLTVDGALDRERDVSERDANRPLVREWRSLTHGANEACPKVQSGVWSRCLGHPESVETRTIESDLREDR